MAAESTAKTMEPSLTSQTAVVDQLKTGLEQMKSKLAELIAKRNELAARASTVKAHSQIHDAMAAVTAGDPASSIGRFEEKIRRQEATVRGEQELDSSSLGQDAELTKAAPRQPAVHQPAPGVHDREVP